METAPNDPAFYFATAKIDPLLHAFYILTHPDQAIKEPILVDDNSFSSAGVLTPGPEETDLVDPAVPFDRKEAYIRAQMEPIIQALELGIRHDAYEILIAFCIGFFPADSLVGYPDLTSLDPRVILPPREVVDAMVWSWSSSNDTPCQALKEYLESTLSGN